MILKWMVFMVITKVCVSTKIARQIREVEKTKSTDKSVDNTAANLSEVVIQQLFMKTKKILLILVVCDKSWQKKILLSVEDTTSF
jgi:hypothetical protein